MRSLGQLKGIILVVAIAGIFTLMGLVIGSSLSSDKLSAQEKSAQFLTASRQVRSPTAILPLWR